MTLKEVQALIKNTLHAAGVESAGVESQLILESLGFSRLDLAVDTGRHLTLEQETFLNNILTRRKTREPLQHILGYAYFYGLKLKVTPHVLIPRPETERLVEIALTIIRDIEQPIVLDIGTGSGAIALAIKQQRPDAILHASDISENALAVARQNAQEHHLKISFYLSNLLEAESLQDISRTSDLIVANLPYLPLGDQKHVSPEVSCDPQLALYAGEDGLSLFRKLIDQCKTFRHPELLLELDPRNIHQALAYVQSFSQGQIYQDLVRRERFLFIPARCA